MLCCFTDNGSFFARVLLTWPGHKSKISPPYMLPRNIKASSSYLIFTLLPTILFILVACLCKCWQHAHCLGFSSYFWQHNCCFKLFWLLWTKCLLLKAFQLLVASSQVAKMICPVNVLWLWMPDSEWTRNEWRPRNGLNTLDWIRLGYNHSDKNWTLTLYWPKSGY